MDETLFKEDQEKIKDAVNLNAMGSRQIGEIARLSASLYNMGVDVENYLKRLHKKFGIKN